MTPLAPCAEAMLALLNRHVSSLPTRDVPVKSPQGLSFFLSHYLSPLTLSLIVSFQGLLAFQDKL